MFAGELEVDGDLTVTGEVQSPTIEALLAQIAVLEAQIALLQAQFNLSNNTRIVTYSITDMDAYEEFHINLDDLLGFDVGIATVSILGISNCSGFTSSSTGFSLQQEEGSQVIRYALYPNCHLEGDIYNSTHQIFYELDDVEFSIESIDNYPNAISFDIHLIITGQFPE